MTEGKIETKLRRVEKDLYKDTIELIDELNLKKNDKILLITGTTHTKILGEMLKNEIEKNSNYEVKHFTVEKVDSPSITDALELAQKENVKVVISRASGKCDLAKYISSYLKIPFINIPSAPTNDAIASPLVVIKDEKGFSPHSIRALPPYGVLIDEKEIIKSPPDLVRAGIGDLSDKILANYEWKLETKLSKEGKIDENKIEVPFNKEIAEKCINAQKSVFNTILEMKEINENKIPWGPNAVGWEKCVLQLTYALCNCGKAMSSITPYSSRPCSGAGHSFSHALDILLPIPEPHGIEVSEGVRIAHLLLETYANEKLDITFEKLKEVLNYTNTRMKWKGIENEGKMNYLNNGIFKAMELGRERPRITTFNYLSDFIFNGKLPKIDKKFLEEIY